MPSAKLFRLLTAAAAALMLASIAGCAGSSAVREVSVTSLADNGGPGELRPAIIAANANPGSTIRFPAWLSGTILLTSGLPPITSSVTIDGPGAQVLAVDGAGLYRPFEVDGAGAVVNISKLTIQHGSDRADSFGGGGICNGNVEGGTTLPYGTPLPSGGIMSLSDCVITNNSASNGGAIVNGGQITITNCTISSNTTAGEGGAIDNYGSAAIIASTLSGNSAQDGGALSSGNSYGSLASRAGRSYSPRTVTNVGNTTQFVNCTLTANTATLSGGAVLSLAPAFLTNCTLSANRSSQSQGGGVSFDATLRNCILHSDAGGEIYAFSNGSLGNTVHVVNSDVDGGVSAIPNITDFGGNIASDPQLGPLADNGGPTLTMALGAGSPCFGAGSPIGAPSVDQRGVPRPVSPSIGAYDAH